MTGGFYEDDEPLEDVVRAFDDGAHEVTRPPLVTLWTSDRSQPLECRVTTTAYPIVLTFMGVPMFRIA